MTPPETTPFDDGLSQNHSSQDYLPPPGNQLQYTLESNQNRTLHNGVSTPVVDYPVKTNPTTYQGKSLEDILSDFIPFDTTTNLTVPWEAEAERDNAFIQEQFAEFTQLIIEIWAWNMARVKYITEAGGERLGGQLSETIAAEKEQGMSGSLVTSKFAVPRMATRTCTDIFVEVCLRLQDFVAKMKLAINGLCRL